MALTSALDSPPVKILSQINRFNLRYNQRRNMQQITLSSQTTHERGKGAAASRKACRCSFDDYEHTPRALDPEAYFSNNRSGGMLYSLF